MDEAIPGLACPHLPPPPPLASMCVPVIAQGEVLGLLHLARHAPLPPLYRDVKSKEQAEEMERLAEEVSGRMALAISNLNLRERLRSPCPH